MIGRRDRVREIAKPILRTAVPVGLRRYLASLVVDDRTRRFIQHNRKIWADWREPTPDAEVLVDLGGVPQTIIAYSYTANVLARKHNACVKTFTSGRWTSSFNPHHLTLGEVYESFNATEHVTAVAVGAQRARAEALARAALAALKTKQDVFDLKVLDVWIGIEIYESYLARFRQPTVRIDDPRLHQTVREAVELLVFWLDYFATRKVAAVIVSHDSYLEWNIISKVAYLNRVPVYLPCLHKIVYTDRPFAGYEDLRDYRDMFRRLPRSDQEAAIALARKQLERRLGGEVGVDMPYSTASAFRRDGRDGRVLRESDRLKVLICTHCFYDNPHGLGGMLFVDFYEWLRYLGRMSERTDYDWYLKTHPDPLPETDAVIREILAEYPRITVVPPTTSHHQLVREGIRVALTVYGSIGHELPAMGVQVVNAGYNPRIAYDFNWHARTLAEYEHYLLHLEELEKPIDLNEIYEFYYMNYSYVIAEDLFLDSYAEFAARLSREDQTGPAAYAYFLDRLTRERHERIVANVTAFVDSGKRNYFCRGPE